MRQTLPDNEDHLLMLECVFWFVFVPTVVLIVAGIFHT